MSYRSSHPGAVLSQLTNTIDGEREYPMDYNVRDTLSPIDPKMNYMYSIGLIKDETWCPEPGLASLHIIEDNHMIFYAQFTKSQLRKFSDGSWKIVRVSEEIVKSLYAFDGKHPYAINRFVIHDTEKFFDVGELQENIRDLSDPNRYMLCIHPREARADDYRVSFRSRQKAPGRPTTDILPFEHRNCQRIDEDPIPETDLLEESCPKFRRPNKRGPWSDERNCKLAAKLCPTSKMDAKRAYKVLCDISLPRREIDSFDEYFRTVLPHACRRIKLIGVGSYGIAVARREDSVLKLIPLSDEKVIHVLREVFITAHLSNHRYLKGDHWKFPIFYSCAVVNGGLDARVQSLLVESAEGESFMAPNIRKWLVIDIEYGGKPLCQYARAPEGRLLLWHHGCALSILAQVINTLAEAENSCQFEHRDCHWENILVSEGAVGTTAFMEIYSDPIKVSLRTFDLDVMLIDFGLARCRTPHGLEYSDVSREDPEILNQSGTVQYEVYKKMHEIVGDDWRGWHPKTNAVWIEYLVDKLLHRVGYMLESAPEYAAYKSFIEKFQRTLDENRSRMWHNAREYRHLLCTLLLREKIETSERAQKPTKPNKK